jgi:hypothetical protein
MTMKMTRRAPVARARRARATTRMAADAVAGVVAGVVVETTNPAPNARKRIDPSQSVRLAQTTKIATVDAAVAVDAAGGGRGMTSVPRTLSPGCAPGCPMATIPSSGLTRPRT